jgi:hypothetical protein
MQVMLDAGRGTQEEVRRSSQDKPCSKAGVGVWTGLALRRQDASYAWWPTKDMYTRRTQQRKRRNGQLVLHECLSLKDAERYTNFSEFLDI